MDYERVTITVPPETMAKMSTYAKDCSLDVGTWLSEVLDFMNRKADFASPDSYVAAVRDVQSRSQPSADGADKPAARTPV